MLAMPYALRLLVLAVVASSGAGRTSLHLSWELTEDVFAGPTDRGASRAVFTLTNRGTKPLADRGWMIYFNALHNPLPESVRGGVSVERVEGTLLRIVPGPDFSELRPGASARFEYLAPLIANVSFAPTGPYLVFDDAPDRGHPFEKYTAVPFERPLQPGRSPAVVTPEAQYALDEAVREIPVE